MPDVVIVTTENALCALIDRAVDRAVRRAVASLVEDVSPDDEWITPRVAQKVYGRHRTTLSRWSRSGILPTRRLGHSVYYSRHAVSRLAGQAGG